MLRMPRSTPAPGLVSALDPRRFAKRHVVQTAEHLRPSDCKELNCPHWRLGWDTFTDERTVLGQQQAYYIRHKSDREFIEYRNETGGTTFHFPPGQKCFQTHRIQTGEAPIKLLTLSDGRTVQQPTDRWFYEANEEVYRAEEIRKRG